MPKYSIFSRQVKEFSNLHPTISKKIICTIMNNIAENKPLGYKISNSEIHKAYLIFKQKAMANE